MIFDLIIATGHTHGAFSVISPGNDFSKADKENAKSRNLDNFVVTPQGRIKRYDCITGRTEMLSHKTFHDRNSKGLFGLFHKCSKCV